MSSADELSQKTPRYRQVKAYIENIIRDCPETGKRLPSLRELCRIFAVSPPTVVKAYSELEASGRVYSVPKSGYFVARVQSCERLDEIHPLLPRIYRNSRLPGVVPLSIDAAAKGSDLWDKLQQKLRLQGQYEPYNVQGYTLEGQSRLRAAIAHLYSSEFELWDYQDVLITSSSSLALMAALKAASRSSHVLVESPCSWAVLEMIETLGLSAVEVDFREPRPDWRGYLEALVTTHGISAAIIFSRFNPVTGCAPERPVVEALLDTLARHGMTLIENDVYGDLVFEPLSELPKFSSDKVIRVGSFAKTISPSCSIGFVVSKKTNELLAHIRHTPNTLSPRLQDTLADLMLDGNYQAALAQQRAQLRAWMERMYALLQRYCPVGSVAFCKPVGGAVIWVELQNRVTAIALYNRLIEQGVSIAPGGIFSAGKRYDSSFRISHATDWSESTERAVATIGATLKALEVASA